MNNTEEFDKLKTKLLKYILYKKRTEYEVRQKFTDINIDQNLLEEVIEHLKEIKYISDSEYIKKAIKEFINNKNLSITEVKHKLQAKGLDKSIVENYIYENKDMLYEYEQKSAKQIILKKQKTMNEEKIKKYLMTKGYMSDII